MDHDQFKIMAQASINDVEYLAKLKSDLEEAEFNSLAFKTLNRFIDNKEIVSKMMDIGSHNWELSLILEMEKEPWFSESLLYLTRSLRSTMIKNKEKGISIIEQMYPSIHESLACYHDSFFLQQGVNSQNPRHTVRAYFRMLGDTVESTHKPLALLIYRMISCDPSNQLYGRPEVVSFGKAVSSLLEINQLEVVYKTQLYGVSLSQWRNIAQHSGYQYNKVSKTITCIYGLNNSQTVHLTVEQLLELLFALNKLQALQKIAVSFCMIEFMEEIQFDKYGRIELTIETIISQIGNGIGLEGFKVLSVNNDRGSCVFKIEDTANKGLVPFKQMVNRLSHFMGMLKETGHDPVFELFTLNGKKLTEARVMTKQRHG
ncbi:hypothetical protein EH243_12570 [Amphritea opalescens]|uniref:Uncharacterized protein n=1 Tax=Amphritea opalescens TaxID=2490544 RepID=A0A430KP37_9GAMM|nr:hypothetical protein [Amphritea opalescens]RTE65268.1 hypothetical protein EH243_12570 [Amphritea opalescens]